MTDDGLIRQYAATRDAEAFRRLVERYSGLVYRTCLRVTGNRHDAEDAAQECFLALARKAATIKSSPAGWLHATARNASLDVARSVNRKKEREAAMAADSLRGGTTSWKDIEPYVDEALASLDDELKAPIILYYIEGRPQDEVAEALGVDQSTVSRRVTSGVEALRKRLAQAGVTLSLAALALALSEASASAAAVPVALTAALGKMAVAGVGTGAATTAGAPFVSTALGKLLLAAAALVVIVTGALVAIHLAGLSAPKPAPVAVNAPNSAVKPAAPLVAASCNAPLEAGAPDDHPAVAAPKIPKADVPANVKFEEGRAEILDAKFAPGGADPFMRSVATAMRAAGEDVTYDGVMGASGQAFRIQSIEPGFCPSAVNPFAGAGEWAALKAALPRTLESYSTSPGGRRDPDLSKKAVDALVASIDRGIPVLLSEWTMYICVGYDDDGQTLLVMTGDGKPPAATSDLPWSVIVVGATREMPGRGAAARAAVENALRLWNAGTIPGAASVHAVYGCGKAGWERWIAGLRDDARFDKLTDAGAGFDTCFASNAFGNAWAYRLLVDARHTAARYLDSITEDLGPAAAPHLKKASALYARVADTLEPGAKFALSPNDLKTRAAWTKDLRESQARVMTDAFAVEQQAVSELEAALAAAPK